MSLKDDPFASFVRLTGGELARTGIGADVSRAIISHQPDKLADLLHRGMIPNNMLGRMSYIQAAMQSYLFDCAAGAAPDLQHRGRQICMLLLNAGSRLDHAPIDAGDLPSALGNPLVWADPEFGRDSLIAASATALRQNFEPPRLSVSGIFTPLGSASDTAAADYLIHAYALVMDVQREVAARLDCPRTEAEKFVSTNLPPEHRQFWRDAASAKPPQILSF